MHVCLHLVVVFSPQWTDCTILGRHFERVSVPAHVCDKHKILMADREFAFVSGQTRRLSVEFAFISGRKGDAIPVSLFCRANFHAVDQDKSAERAKEVILSDL